MDLTGREIVLGVTGGIAAYKSAEIVSRLLLMLLLMLLMSLVVL